ncbi:MAG TPA: hypothetical protein VJT09_11990 [Pyrinomonadaceae bacterium]|nr:hypothetical protein [Pyrinomonadaceae bacterium]
MSKYEDADLILKLYDMRREEVMRKARNWFFEFNPEGLQDFQAVMMSEHSAYYRMVTTYWDMACSFVNNGAIDPKMFADANAEHMAIYLKLEPFLPELRQVFDMPTYLQNLEQCVKSGPNAEEYMTKMRERFAKFRAMREEAAKKAQAG